MYGWLRRTFGKKTATTAEKQLSQEIAQETAEGAAKKGTIRKIAPYAGVGIVGHLYGDDIIAGIGDTGAEIGKTIFGSKLMVGVGLLMVGGIFYVVFK